MGAVQHNQVSGVVLDQQASTGWRRWRVLLANGCEIEVRAPAHAYASLALAAGQSVRLSLRKEAVVVVLRAAAAS